MSKITPFLWFDTQAEEAAKFYTAVFPNSKITNTNYYGDGGPMAKGTALTVSFELNGLEFTALNAGPIFKFTEAVSFYIHCKDQQEIDYYWDKLTEGGQPSQCGWLKDKYGLSWQVVPEQLGKMLSDKDRAKAQRAMNAMMKMTKLDLPALQKAFDGK